MHNKFFSYIFALRKEKSRLNITFHFCDCNFLLISFCRFIKHNSLIIKPENFFFFAQTRGTSRTFLLLEPEELFCSNQRKILSRTRGTRGTFLILEPEEPEELSLNQRKILLKPEELEELFSCSNQWNFPFSNQRNRRNFSLARTGGTFLLLEPEEVFNSNQRNRRNFSLAQTRGTGGTFLLLKPEEPEELSFFEPEEPEELSFRSNQWNKKNLSFYQTL